MESVDSVLQYLRNISLTRIAPFDTIHYGTLPIEESLVMDLGPASPFTIYQDRSSLVNMSIIFNGKSGNRSKILNTMNTVHRYLTQDVCKHLPILLGDDGDVQIVSIETQSHPTFAKREVSVPKQYLYTSSIRVQITYEGRSCYGSW